MGRAYYRHLKANGLDHLDPSEECRARFEHNNPYAIRYVVTHDLHHLLTGFDTGMPGEVGAAAFQVGQGTGFISEANYRYIRYAYMALMPGQARAISNNLNLALEMGKKADNFLFQPFESMMHEPLAEVRARLGIEDADRAKIIPSKPSALIAGAYKLMGRELPMPQPVE